MCTAIDCDIDKAKEDCKSLGKWKGKNVCEFTSATERKTVACPNASIVECKWSRSFPTSQICKISSKKCSEEKAESDCNKLGGYFKKEDFDYACYLKSASEQKQKTARATKTKKYASCPTKPVGAKCEWKKFEETSAECIANWSENNCNTEVAKEECNKFGTWVDVDTGKNPYTCRPN
jgi:hypothetical protein